jgi:mono/diheme cytochrome c family protein
MRYLWPLFPLLAGVLPAAPAPDYNRDIKPILSENCFSCHGFDEKARKAKLRLDVAADARRERNGLTPIKPGDAAGSEVWQRLISKDPEEVMPPPDAHRTFTDAQRELVRSWIEAGANYAERWAFVPPVKAPLPAVAGRRAAHPIDAWVRARLATEKLSPAAEADRATLARRLHLDLTGLPPRAEDVAAFVADRSPTAYERLVDRLLANPHFGERLALDWLDAARYADTNGFSIDGGRHLWLWRDWVIQAFNDNKPYDRFLLEQIAGDLLPGRTDADLIASGFQRNNMVTHEGGTIPDENLVNYNADRVKTLGESVLGLTLGCAQCHDHKFDPITQRDYYRMFAYFNTLGDKGLDGNAGINAGPSIRAKTVLRTDEAPALRRDIAALETRLAQRDDAILSTWEAREQRRLAERGRDLRVHPVKVVKISTPNRGAGFEVDGEHRVKIRGAGISPRSMC